MTAKQNLADNVNRPKFETTASITNTNNAMNQPLPTCLLCDRTPKKGTTEHHLIPRTCHRNKWFKKNFTREQMQETVSLCRDCHNAIHKFEPKEKELGRHYHTLELLKSHPQIAKFAAWASKQK